MGKIHEIRLEWQISPEDKSEAKCNLIEILAKVGDHVKKHDSLGVMETDKGTQDLYPPVEGKITEILTALMEYPYGTLFCTIEEK